MFLTRSRLFFAKTLIGLACLCLPQITIAQLYNYAGGIVDLSIAKEGPELPEVKYGLKDVTLFERIDHWRVLVGIDLDTLPGDYLLYIKQAGDDSSAFHQKFAVAQKEPLFISRQIIGSDSIDLDYDNFSDIAFSNTVEPTLPLRYPAAGQWTEQFGALEINTEDDSVQARNYIALTTTQLSTVIAPQNAIVSRVLAAENSQTNNNANLDSSAADYRPTSYTIFLDHGRGLYSILSGVMDITIEAGNGVLAGAVLGKIYPLNSSSDQPHTLYWQTILNGAYVNPAILSQLR